MYDTVNLWLSLNNTNNNNLSVISNNLIGKTEHKTDTGQIFISGYLGNYKVSLSGRGISLKGSIAKYFLSDNFHTLSRSDTARAIEKISDELHLPIEQAKVRRMDFAQNFIVNHKPETYYYYLGECQHYKRLPQPKSLYYSNNKRQKVFYNKIAEGKAKRCILPENWKNLNVLRYEIRFMKGLQQQFNIPEITADMLFDEKFYLSIFDKWQSEYKAINKLHSINFNLSDMNSPKDFWKQINLMAINIIGQDTIMQLVEELRARNAFEKPEYYSRLKRDIRELCKTPKLTTTSSLISELDEKIENADNFCR